MSNSSQSPPLPEGMLDYARASLKIGMSVPEIETRLVAKGLTPSAATAVVNSILEERVANRFEPIAQSERGELLHRLLSVIVACGCIVLGYWFGQSLSAGYALMSVLAPLACIWFPEYLARRTQEGAIRAMGWVVLLMIVAYRIVMLSLAP